MIIGGMAANYGALAGANFMTSQSGIIFRSLMENTGISSQTAFHIAVAFYLNFNYSNCGAGNLHPVE